MNSWTLMVNEKTILAFENKCAQTTLQFPWTANMTNKAVLLKLRQIPVLLQQSNTQITPLQPRAASRETEH